MHYDAQLVIETEGTPLALTAISAGVLLPGGSKNTS
jgi:hypothetical protein